MNPIKQLDFNYGLENENKILSLLKEFFKDDTIQKSKSSTAPFDFEGNNICIELKSRRNLSSAYPTTIIGTSKFKSLRSDCDYYCVFKFTDQILYTKYDPVIFQQYEIKPVVRKDRGKIERQQYFHIPINSLQLIN